MPTCPEDKKGYQWIYPDGQSGQIINVDNYTIDYVPGQCSTKYVVTGRKAYNGLSYCGASFTRDPSLIYNFTVEIPNRIKGIKKILHSTRSKYATNANGTCNTRSIIGTIGYYYSYIDYEGIGDPYAGVGGLIYFYENWLGTETSVIDSITRKDGQPDNCGDCRLRFFKNGSLIQEIIKSPCPTVTDYCEQQQCPPDTCEVECGNTICCYGSDGISVLNFPKP